jgi:hypothetical protein
VLSWKSKSCFNTFGAIYCNITDKSFWNNKPCLLIFVRLVKRQGGTKSFPIFVHLSKSHSVTRPVLFDKIDKCCQWKKAPKD